MVVSIGIWQALEWLRAALALGPDLFAVVPELIENLYERLLSPPPKGRFEAPLVYKMPAPLSFYGRRL